jgi:hypothetical protein
MMSNLTDRTVVLGVTGSIAIYKAADLASKLTQAGALVDVAMTPEATKFVGPITFQSVTGRPVYSDMFDQSVPELHVDLARRADLMVIAPATATTMARVASPAEELPPTALPPRANRPRPGDGPADVITLPRRPLLTSAAPTPLPGGAASPPARWVRAASKSTRLGLSTR